MSTAFALPPVPALPEMSGEEFEYFASAIEARAGIQMKSGKRDLVRTRLRHRILELGFASYGEYRGHLKSLAADDPEWQVFTNLLTTNKTDFFREPKHFEFLRDTILPEWLASGDQTFRVWSAASSSGEEAYTVAMVLDDALPKDRDYQILATDIDTGILERARNAVYPTSRVQEIPEAFHSTALDFGKGTAQGWFRVKSRLKNQVSFASHNLMAADVPGPESFDLILCRNVLIYFSPRTVDQVQRHLHRAARPGGYLFIGHSESLPRSSDPWTPCGPSIFRRQQKAGFRDDGE